MLRPDTCIRDSDTFLLDSATKMFRQQYSSYDMDVIASKLESKSYGTNAKGCKLWLGALNSEGYGKMRFPKISTNTGLGLHTQNAVLVHRLAYFVYTHGAYMFDHMHVSHVCHVKNCVKFEHLNYECSAVNKQRSTCYSNGLCIGHGGEPHCII